MEASARKLGKKIGDALPSTVGYCLLVFDFGPGGHLTYISNSDRGDMLRALDEFKLKMEAS
jgi:hypothetical protein